MPEAVEPPHSADALGRWRTFIRSSDGARATSLWSLAASDASLDRRGLLTAWAQAPESAHTLVQGIHTGACTHPVPLEPGEPAPLELEGRLGAALEGILHGATNAAVALSGGLDSALLLALLRSRGVPFPPLFTLATGFPGYDESEAAARLGAFFGARVERLELRERDYVEALPAAVEAAETSLFNLHPLSRWLLLEALKRRGVDTLLTGDGADQVFAGSSPHLYIPIVCAMARAHGLRTESPFWAPEVQAWAAGRVVDPGKAVLRTLARRLGVPADVVEATKRPRYAPAMDLSRHWSPARMEALSRKLDLPVRTGTDAERVGWTTLGLFCDRLERCT